jgi:hypothetical protein
MSASATDGHKLSTSAVAKALQIPLQQLFVTLRDYGWIRKVEDGWLLTAKGEFEGGEYIHSRCYGRYIVWPETLLEHALLRGLESNRLFTAAQIGRKYGISARETRRLLGEAGLLRRDFNGWELTARGEREGGVLIEGDSGDGDIHWPEALLEHDAIAAQLVYAQQFYADAPEQQGDLLQNINDFRALDGHHLRGRGEWQVCNWLYLAGIVHACGRRLPVEEELYADFWLPAAQVYIECSGDERDGPALAAGLRRLEIYRQQQWRCIEVHAEQLRELDDYLTRQLRALGVAVF